ncbi:MAG TPA: hypothetical protein VMV54_01175 [Acidocella sp.]|nr:hypothetical protein [Acidocella sp.]
MKDALKFALLGVAAYLIGRNFGLFPDVFASTQPPPAAEEPPPTPAPPPPPPPTPSAPAVLILMKAAAVEAGYSDSLGWDQWNWFYNAITGKEGPAPEAVGIPRVDPMPNIAAETWYKAVAAGGFAL